MKNSTFLGIEWPELPFDIAQHAILVERRGSESHGTYQPSPDSIDDRDIFAVVVLPQHYYLGLARFEMAEAISGVCDVLVYDIKKFMGLIAKQNPNMLSALWCRDEDVLYSTHAARYLREQRARLVDTELFYRKRLLRLLLLWRFLRTEAEKRRHLLRTAD